MMMVVGRRSFSSIYLFSRKWLTRVDKTQPPTFLFFFLVKGPCQTVFHLTHVVELCVK